MYDGSLQTLHLGTGVEEIGWRAFQACPITTLTLPASLRLMDFRAFRFCYDISTVVIEDSATPLVIDGNGDSEFASVFSSPESFTVYQGRNIECNSSPYRGNSGLTVYEMGSQVSAISTDYFSGCEGLASVKLGHSLAAIPAGTFNQCTSLLSIDLPDAATSIGEKAFQSSGLRSIRMGPGLQTIDWRAFWDCTDLATITCLATMPPTCTSEEIFRESLYTTATLAVPAASMSTYGEANVWKRFLNKTAATEQVPTAVSLPPSPTTYEWFDLSGRRLSQPQRGINIRRLPYGNVRRVMK